MKWSAGWGSACEPCARAKTRCIRSQEGNDPRCNRCQSLNIACPQQVRKPRKRRRQNAETVPSASIPHPGHDHGSSNSNTTSPQSHGTLCPTECTSISANEDLCNDAAKAESNIYVAQVRPERSGAFSALGSLPGFHPFPTPTCTCLPEADGMDDLGSTESDEALLSIYRKRLSPQFPFVVIPENRTATELQRSRPFLAMAVKMVASLKDRRSMWDQNKVLLRQIFEAVFAGPGRSLDLLQSIIVFLGFSHYFCFAHGHFSSLIHLASSIISDMRLDRPGGRPARDTGLRGIDPEVSDSMSNDERRAVLAVWYLNSSFAVTFKKVNAPGRHFTRHMERQLQELQGRPDYESDEVLAQLVCAQRINEMVSQLELSIQSVDVQLSPDVWTANLDNLLSELDKLRRAEYQQKPHRYLVSSHHSLAMLQLLEPQLLNADHVRHHEAITALQNTPAYFHVPSISKTDSADTALRAWFEDWLAIPVCHFFYMPSSAYLHLTNATVVLLRRSRLVLLTRYRQGNLHALGTGASTSSGTSDDLMLDLLDRLASRLEEARVEMAAALCAEWNNDLLDLVAWKLRERKACIEKWVEAIANENARRVAGVGAINGTGEDPGDFSGFGTIDEQGLWLDPLEALLMSGGDGYGSWV